jgi:hypothetical protein
MGIHFAIDPRQRLVHYVVEGHVGPVDASAFFNAVLAHPDYRCGFDFFGDRRAVDAAPDPSYVYSVAAEVLMRPRFLAPCRWAVVVADDTAEHRARTWAVMAAVSGVEICPFRTAEDAARWLGLPATCVPLNRISGPRTPIPVPLAPGSVATTVGGQALTTAEEHIPLLACPANSNST